jgi:nucleotide-binding universal stress UspA family protein
MKINKILVPYDGSEHSKRAFDYGLDIAKKYNSKLIVASCILVQESLPDSFAPDEDLMLQKQRESAAKLLGVLELESDEAKVRYTGVILKTQSVTDSILSYAESNGIDIIIAGSRGLGGFKRLLLGSVADALVRYSKCPVLMVK